MPLYRITSPEGQTYEIDGPDGATQEEIVAQIKSQIASAQPKEQSQLRQVADVPLKIGAGVVGGVRMVTDAFGANNPVSQNLKGMEGYISDLFSAQSKKDSAEISRIMKDAEDKGVGDQLKAAVNAFSTAPVDFLSHALGTAAPAIAAGMAGAVLRFGAAGVGAMQAGTGATMGAGIVKGSIYDAVKEELKKTDMSPEQVEARAQKAQEYGGENLDSILAGAALTGLASTVGIDPIIARGLSKKIIGEAAGKEAAKQAPKGVVRRTAEVAALEAIPEGLQGAQEKLAENVALQREGIETPTMRGVVGSGALEALAGAGTGAGVGALSPQGTAPEVPPEVTPEVPTGEAPPETPPPIPPATPVEQKMAAEVAPDNYYTGSVEDQGLSLKDIQNRDRSGPASIAQMQAIASKPDYNQVSVSRTLANGAPVVITDTPIPENRMGKVSNISAGDGKEIPIQYAVVEAADLTPSHDASGSPSKDFANNDVESIRPVVGNGRVAGLQQAYINDTAADYKANLLRDDDHGIDPVAIYTMDHPVLVRVMPKKSLTPDIADVGNKKQALEMSAPEQAKIDMGRFDMQGVDFKADGTPTRESLNGFIMAMPQTEHGNLIESAGIPSKQAVERLNNAMFAKAYDSDALINMHTETADPEAQQVMRALAIAAPAMAQLDNAGEYDIRPYVIEAAEMVVNAKRRGVSLEAYVKQRDINESENAGRIFQMFADNIRAPKKMGAALADLADAAAAQTNIEEDMFGDKREPLPLGEFFKIFTEVHDVQGKPEKKAVETPKQVRKIAKPKAAKKTKVAAPAPPTKEQIEGETKHLDNTVKGFIKEKENDFMVGDRVRVGSTPSTVVGIQGDYIKIRPDTATNDKTFHRVLKRQAKLVSRPNTTGTSSASKLPDQKNKFGTEEGRLNADMGNLIQLLGANMYAANLSDVAVKELVQNAFDAVKGAASSKKGKALYKSGHIEITVDTDNRTISVKDDARGMTPEIVRDAFFTVAGSDKSDLDPSERSGGLGLAKMGFMLGAERLSLDTVRDGVRVTVNTTSRDIANNNFKIQKSPAPKSEHGTTITVKIPESYIDPKTGDARVIYFPYSQDSIDPLQQPLIGPVKVDVNFIKNNNTEKTSLPVGVNFPGNSYQKFKVDFSWGNADVFFGVDRVKYPKHKVLSSGVYQFSQGINLNRTEEIPYDIIINVKPNVDARHPDYPFENSRERFKRRLDNDIKSLEAYLQQIARGNEAQDLQENFKGIVSMPRLEAGKEIADLGKKLHKAFGAPALGERADILEIPQHVTIDEDKVTDGSGKILIDMKARKEAEKNKESTFKSEKDAPNYSEFMLQMDQDPKLPIFHNNTNVDFIGIGKEYGNPEQFFAELGTLVVEMKEDLAKSGLWGYETLSPDNLFFGGISIDKEYGGVHIRVPYKAIFLNPFYDWGAKSLFGIRGNFFETITHELAHTGDMDHGVGHNSEMIRVRQHLDDAGLTDYYRDALLDILINHESTFAAMRGAYDKSTTRNIAKSLETGGARSSRISDGSADTGAEGSRGSVQTGRGRGRNEHISATTETGGGGGVNQEGRGINEIDDDPARSSASWNSPEDSQLDRIIEKLQNKHLPLKRVQESIKKSGAEILDENNPYQKEELYHNRTSKRVDDFISKELNPLLEEMKRRDVTLDQVEEYLQARHAEEANRVIAERNPDDKELQDGGSGMDTADAKEYLDGLSKSERERLSAVAEKVDAILENTRNIYVSEKLVSKAQMNSWKDMFKHYIPLMREDKDGAMGVGQGYSIRGKEVRHRTGSKSKVIDVIANIAIQREKAIVRSEKNRVGKALVGLVKLNPNPEFWTINKVPTERVLNEKTGLVEERSDPLYYKRDNVITVKIEDSKGDIKEHAVVFNEKNPVALRLASALKNLDATQLEGVMAASATITRYFSAINTQYNPIFGVVNLIRDAQGSLVNLQSTPLAGHQKEVLSKIVPSLAGIYSAVRNTRKGKETTNSYGKLFDELQLEGGMTGYRDLYKDSSDRSKAIKYALDPHAWQKNKLGKIFTAGGRLKVPLAVAQDKAKVIFDWLSDYNLAMEGAARLAVYKTALDNDMSKQQAASLAKNISVNFNRKGLAGQQAGALFAFFNASMQGTARIGETLFIMNNGNIKTLRLNGLGKKIVGGGILLGSMQAMALSLAGFDDDEPPEFIRERNFILPIGGKKYLTLPMPLGFHAIPNIGRITTEFALGGFKKPGDHVLKLLGVFADAFNPIGNSGLSVQTIAPTPIDPLVALGENRDWTGQPISREDYNKLSPTPGFTRSKDVSSDISRLLAEAINYLSGGTKYTPGKLSPTADQIDYLAGQVTGGVGREAAKISQTTKAVSTGEELPPHKIPLVGRFYGDTDTQSSQGAKFYANLKKLNEVEAELKGRIKDRIPTTEYRSSHPELRLVPLANRVESSVSELRTLKRKLIEKDAPKEKIKNIETRITVLMKRLNDRVREHESREK